MLDFKREVLAEQGAKPNAERREVAIDLREDWPQALRDNGFDATKPSAWIAEGLLVYLPAAAQQQLFSGIDALAAPAATSEWKMPPRCRRTRSRPPSRMSARLAPREIERLFFQLTYNEQHAPAEQWFGEHGWIAVATPLADYFRDSGASGARTGYRGRADDRPQHLGPGGQAVRARCRTVTR